VLSRGWIGCSGQCQTPSVLQGLVGWTVRYGGVTRKAGDRVPVFIDYPLHYLYPLVGTVYGARYAGRLRIAFASASPTKLPVAASNCSFRPSL
jgi:hypothetical protein